MKDLLNPSQRIPKVTGFNSEDPMDNTVGPTDMPSIWNPQKYKPEKGHFMNLAGDSHDARSIIMDSALGVIGEAEEQSGIS